MSRPHLSTGLVLEMGSLTARATLQDPDVRVDYVDILLWELDPVEVRPRPVPPATTGELPRDPADLEVEDGGFDGWPWWRWWTWYEHEAFRDAHATVMDAAVTSRRCLVSLASG